MTTFLFSLLFMVLVRIALWFRFNNPYQQGVFLQPAIHYRDTGRLESMYDFYPSWRKHPLSVMEYRWFFRSLGLFLKCSKLTAFRGSQLFQLLLSVLLALVLSRIVPHRFSPIVILSMSVCIAPLFLSLIITPDIMLMTATGITIFAIHDQVFMDPWIYAIILGFLGFSGIRIKSSGLTLSMSIIFIIPFLFKEWGPGILAATLTILPLLLDLYQNKEDMILVLMKRSIKAFGYSLEDDKICAPPSELRYRKLHIRVKSFFQVLGAGFSIALNPFHKFSLYQSNGLFYPVGFIGMIYYSLFKPTDTPVFVVLLFSWFYFLLSLIFFSLIRRHFHFAGRAGGTLSPILILWTVSLLASLDEYGQILVGFLIIMEGLRSAKKIFSRQNLVLYETIHPLSYERKPVIAALKKIIKPKDLLFLTYRDLAPFGLELGTWQAVIELEKATVPIVYKYIDYYTHDMRYNRIYLILPPKASVFFDKDRRFHYIEEPELASRFKQIHKSLDLNGYRIFEAVRPHDYRDLTHYEGFSPDQLKNMAIDFGSQEALT